MPRFLSAVGVLQMDLCLDYSILKGYSSSSQKVRVISERWVAQNLYCPVCGNMVLSQYTANKPVADFFCEVCGEDFELKAKSASRPNVIQNRIINGAYSTMIERITALHNPNLLYMTYSSMRVANMLIIPKFFFVPDIIEKRKALGPTARRAGWVGCNINLANVPEIGRISIIVDGLPKEPQQVVDEYTKAALIRTDSIEKRGWLLDVLRCVDQLPAEFTLRDMYGFTEQIASLHPNNNNVQAKIRQQLQILRDKGFIEFTARGSYRKI